MIPKKLKNELTLDPKMKRCAYCGVQSVEWHHVFQFNGKQIQEKFNIVPAYKKHHDEATSHKNGYKQEVREFFEWVALQKMDGDMLRKYSKSMDNTWANRARYLLLKAKEYDW